MKKFFVLLALLFPLAICDAQTIFATYGDNTLGSWSADGSTINATLISGLRTPSAASDGTYLYVTNYHDGAWNNSSGSLSKYSTSGAVVSSPLVSSLQWPGSVCLAGSTVAVGCQGNGGQPSYIATYQTNGTPIGNMTVGVNPLKMAAAGDSVFFCYLGDSNIQKYDLTTGNVTTFLSGLSAQSISVYNSVLYVSQQTFDPDTLSETNWISTFNATTGSSINPNFITGLSSTAAALAVSADGVFLGLNSSIAKYNLSGGLVNASFITGVNNVNSITFVPVPEPPAWAWLLAPIGLFLATMAQAKQKSSG